MIYKKKLLKYKGGLYTAEFTNRITGKKHLRYFRHAGYRYDEIISRYILDALPGIYVYEENKDGTRKNNRFDALAKRYFWLNQQVHEGNYEHVPDTWISSSYLDKVCGTP